MSNHGQTVALEPCPFCAGSAGFGTVKYSESTVREQQWEQDTFHFVSCERCATNNKGLTGFRDEGRAALHWNMRAKPVEPLTAVCKGGDTAPDIDAVIAEAKQTVRPMRMAYRSLSDFAEAIAILRDEKQMAMGEIAEWFSDRGLDYSVGSFYNAYKLYRAANPLRP